MNQKLTEKQLKTIIKQERVQRSHPYKDESDLMVDMIFDLYEKKAIDEKVFQTLTSLVLFNLTRDTVHNITGNLIKKNLNLTSNNAESNKVFLLNYSKQSYA